MKSSIILKIFSFSLTWTMFYNEALAARTTPYQYTMSAKEACLWLLFLILALLLAGALLLLSRTKNMVNNFRKKPDLTSGHVRRYLTKLNGSQLKRIIDYKKNQHITLLLLATGLNFLPFVTAAQGKELSVTRDTLLGEIGIIVTLVLLAIPILFIAIFLFVKIKNRLGVLNSQRQRQEAEKVAAYLNKIPYAEIELELEERRTAETYQVDGHTLSGHEPARDTRALIQIKEKVGIPIVSAKKRAVQRPNVDPSLSKLVVWYLVSATAWLLFGTTVGEYVGIKFVAPDIESLSWLSFGRLRPVHTNAVFWGWASIAMLGLAYYAVPRVSNTRIYNLKWGWYSLHLINLSVVLGTITLMAGVNNAGGEYREYIWPIMLLFGIALALTLVNFYKTIAQRKTREIYISNWYIVSAIIFTIVIALVAYLPFWQRGLGETIVQGYYMHQGVGMWFMLFTLGLVYYFLPQQLNKPIYSYSLGVLAFWTQILFYTLIGSHHFVFSSIPWWLQTVAIVGSAGMAIPVIAGTTNFLMTFKGAWYKVKDSYTLPFFLVGIIFYFTGSMQGTAEAFRATNLIWHFTDFTVAHSHLTMYGIICFLLWACIYTIVPRLTGKEAPQLTIGAHFWLALIGMMFYTVPLMYGSTLKGLMWMEGKPFIDGVVFMAPYWLWRAIGGSLMWLSHFFFAYNIYRMVRADETIDIGEEIVDKLEKMNSTVKDNNF